MNAKGKSIMSDLKKLDKMQDKDIDYSDSSSLDASFFTRETIQLPKEKGLISSCRHSLKNHSIN